MIKYRSIAEIYKYEIPGGQYSNLKPQVKSFGLGHKFYEVKEMYKKVNEMLGDIIKVTPFSKVVGDLAIFMIQNELTPENVVEKGKSIDFPDSAVSYFEGMIGQPEGGFPKDLAAGRLQICACPVCSVMDAKGRPINTIYKTLGECFDKLRIELFMHDFRVDFDNNLSERDLRKVKNREKVAGGFRKDSGHKMYCAVMTMMETFKK